MRLTSLKDGAIVMHCLENGKQPSKNNRQMSVVRWFNFGPKFRFGSEIGLETPFPKPLYKQSLEDKGVSNQEIRNEPTKGRVINMPFAGFPSSVSGLFF
jgi:hypothetical protein